MAKIIGARQSGAPFHMVKIVYGHSEVTAQPSEQNPQPTPVCTHNAEFFGQGHSFASALDDANGNLQKFLKQTQIEITLDDEN